MCGIIGYTGIHQAAPTLLDGLSAMEYRGYDSAGVAVIGADGIQLSKVEGKVVGLYEKTDNGTNIAGVCGIGHTRWATHGGVSERNAHPHMSSDKKFAVAHNGIIENYLDLKKELIAEGVQFASETDTEVFVQLLAKNYSGDFKDAVLKTVARLRGAYALAIVCNDYPGVIFAVRNNAPLILGVGEGENYFASDITALLKHTKNAIYMDNGEIAEVTKDAITVFNYAGKVQKKEVVTVEMDATAAEKGGYEHFMMKEIMEEPQAVRNAITPRIKDGKINLDGFTLTKEELQGISRIIITACGSANYAGMGGKYAIENLCGIPVSVELASELRYADTHVDEHTLLIVVSQSGETADTIAALEECKARGARILAIVNVVESTIARLADHVLYTWAGPEIAVATTKGYTTQLAVLFMFAVYAAGVLETVTPEEYSKLVAEIMSMPVKMQKSIDMNKEIGSVASTMVANEHVYFIGRNTDWALAMEGALKLKEISYIHAEAYAAGELKHGTIALIEENTPVVAVACNHRLLEKTASNIIELKARGAKIFMVAPEGCKMVEHADVVIYVPEMRDIFASITAVLPLQMLAYYVALDRGCDIDKPRNLAKSVTVE